MLYEFGGILPGMIQIIKRSHFFSEKMDNKINLKTAFFWRHKILKVLTKKDDNDKLGGIIEADETFFEESKKRK